MHWQQLSKLPMNLTSRLWITSAERLNYYVLHWQVATGFSVRFSQSFHDFSRSRNTSWLTCQTHYMEWKRSLHRNVSLIYRLVFFFVVVMKLTYPVNLKNGIFCFLYSSLLFLLRYTTALVGFTLVNLGHEGGPHSRKSVDTSSEKSS